MASRRAFLLQVWKEVIDPWADEKWMNSEIVEGDKNPNAPFAYVTPVLKKIVSRKGACAKDVAQIARMVAFSTVASLLYMLDDPGVNGSDMEYLHEELLKYDTTGTEGREPPLQARRRRSEK